MTRYSNDDIVKFFENAGYGNVEIIGDRIMFTTGEDVFNWGIDEAVKFLQDIYILT